MSPVVGEKRSLSVNEEKSYEKRNQTLMSLRQRSIYLFDSILGSSLQVSSNSTRAATNTGHRMDLSAEWGTCLRLQWRDGGLYRKTMKNFVFIFLLNGVEYHHEGGRWRCRKPRRGRRRCIMKMMSEGEAAMGEELKHTLPCPQDRSIRDASRSRITSITQLR
ncbi:hypothetical protein L6452_44076 [Arctium lappa]|uniref:Uncharacterized protein n=1 Tax=Arctium lappa TaxID=4217 RepID=A0ACB8XF16_ARCLA|nr:hypothetical protein L6452_44076 [Arctium lappa]